ncbi:MAG: TlpA disulfide reductase family protein [Gemmatimonadota bacterium]|nr:TlpA disulfide reductase family protein [Gemmatimonadota bacterium]
MNFTGKFKLPVTLLILSAVFSCSAGNSSEKSASPSTDNFPVNNPVAKSQQAPDFTLELIDGGKFSLSSLRGKVVILDFWATWCPPCLKGVPEFVELYNSYRNKGLEIVGVSVDRGGPRVVKKFIKENKVPYTNVMAEMSVLDAYEVYAGIPTTFIIDREGKVVTKIVGYHPKSFFEAHLNRLL